MVIACPNCKARFNLDSDKIGPGGVKVRCTKCSTLFMVKRPPSTASAPAAAPAPVPAPAPAAEAGAEPKEPDPFGDETKVVDSDLIRALQAGEMPPDQLVSEKPPAPEPPVGTGTMGTDDFAWDDGFESASEEAPVPDLPAPKADDDLFTFGDPAVGLDAGAGASAPAPAPGPDSAGDPFGEIDAALAAAPEVPMGGPAAPDPVAAEPPAPGPASDGSDVALDQDLFGDLAAELSIDAPPPDAGTPAPADLDPSNALSPEPQAAAEPAPELSPEPQPEIAETSFDASVGSPPPGQSGELAQDLFGDLDAESLSPAPAPATSSPVTPKTPSAVGFDFDSIDMSDAEISPPSAARGEDVFGTGADVPAVTGNLEVDFGLGGAPAEPPAPTASEPAAPARAGAGFYAQSDEAVAERPDWYGRFLAVIGGAASLALVGMLLFAGDRVDFSQLTGAWLFGGETVGLTENLAAEQVSAFPYSTASGRSLLVVEGMARNLTDKPQTNAHVRATIYDYAGRLVYARSGQFGCSLTPRDVRGLERETDLDTVCNSPAEVIPPGETVPFVIVFFDAPVRIARYRYSVDLSITPPAAPAETAPPAPDAPAKAAPESTG